MTQSRSETLFRIVLPAILAWSGVRAKQLLGDAG